MIPQVHCVPGILHYYTQVLQRLVYFYVIFPNFLKASSRTYKFTDKLTYMKNIYITKFELPSLI